MWYSELKYTNGIFCCLHKLYPRKNSNFNTGKDRFCLHFIIKLGIRELLLLEHLITLLFMVILSDIIRDQHVKLPPKIEYDTCLLPSPSVLCIYSIYLFPLYVLFRIRNILTPKCYLHVSQIDSTNLWLSTHGRSRT